ncbi:MAG: Tol-Pal system protein TolQ [Chlamydiia bacterium]|nr:Tol-Pal system protein TolQ [Chlamydiia bacterium]
MSIFFTSYADSDLFGKLIFIMLFALSIISWTVLIRKIKLIKFVKSQGDETVGRAQSSDLKSLLFEKDFSISENPFTKVLDSISSKTSQILQKNHHFKENHRTFLSQRDMQVIDEFSSMTIYKEVKSLGHDLFILSTVVSLAPFLGILGTVWGILISLGELQKSASASNAIVLGGLSTALATTVLGLVIAIPALIAYNYLKNSLSQIGSEMEGFSHHILSELELAYRNVEV